MNESILIVDDEQYVVDGIKAGLVQHGYTAFTALSGAKALDILAIEDIDLIIADINMPEIDGNKILTAVKEIEPDTPVIIITGIHADDVERLAAEWGADNYLAKPFETPALISMIREILDKKAG